MSEFLAWVRNVLIALAALTLFAGAATQLFAAIFGYAPHFGEPTAFWFGHPVYDPWRFLQWALNLAPHRPWIAFLCLSLALIIVLAAFAVLALAGLVAPADLPRLKSRRGYADWDIVSQRGLLAANGLALGAVSRFAWEKPDIVYAPAGNTLILGQPRHTDAALLATVSVWRGAVVFIDARGLASKLVRRDIVRFAPSRTDSASTNPMLAIRGGAHAWADARLLARALLRLADNAATDAFAVLVLDQLLNAPLERRNLAALRKRLAAPGRALAEIVATWPEALCSAPAPYCEIARAARAWRGLPNATLAHLAAIDLALSCFADGELARATDAHQFTYADLVAGEGPDTIVLAPPPGEAADAAPLFSAMLAQLVAVSAPDADRFGRPRKRELLVAIEAEALQLLMQQSGSMILPAHAAVLGCRLLVQAPSIEHASGDIFAAIAAIGPQDDATADKLAARAGTIAEWRLLGREEASIRTWAAPSWARVVRQIVSISDLADAEASQATLFLQDIAPVRARSVYIDGQPATFLSGADLKAVGHDWSAPPASADRSPPPASPEPASSPPIGANIRAVLTRRAPPRAKPKARAP